MRYYTVVLLALALRLSSALADELIDQKRDEKGDDGVVSHFAVGFQMGNTFSRLSAPSGIAAKNRSSICGGFSLQYRLNDSVAFFSGANYSSYSYNFGEYAGRVQLDYAEVPLFFKATIPVGPIKPFVMGGPVVGFRILAETRAQGNSTTGMQPVIDAKSATNSLALGLAAGAGVDYSISNRVSLYGLGWYMQGLSDADSVDAATTTVSGMHLLGGVSFLLF